MRLVISLYIVSTCLLMVLLTFPLDVIFKIEGNKTHVWCRSLKVRRSPHASPPALSDSMPDHIHLREWSSKATQLICLTVCTWAYMCTNAYAINEPHTQAFLPCAKIKHLQSTSTHVILELNPSVLSALVPPTEKAICFITGVFAT